MLGGVQSILEALGRGRFPLSREADCQAAIDEWLHAQLPGVEISREHRLGPGDRPDWLIDGRFVVEAKLGGRGQQRRAIARQIGRYLAYDQVEAVVLATGVSMPPLRGVKPIHIVSLGRAWL